MKTCASNTLSLEFLAMYVCIGTGVAPRTVHIDNQAVYRDSYQLSVIKFIHRAQTSSLNAIGGATRQGASCP